MSLSADGRGVRAIVALSADEKVGKRGPNKTIATKLWASTFYTFYINAQ